MTTIKRQRFVDATDDMSDKEQAERRFSEMRAAYVSKRANDPGLDISPRRTLMNILVILLILFICIVLIS